MESELIKAGWEKRDANLYTHTLQGDLYRNERNGRWYLRRKGRADELMGRILREAIPAVLKLERLLF